MPTSSNEKELPATKYIPYTVPLDEFTNATVDGDLTRTIQLSGVPFETLANADLNGLSKTWFSTINSIGARSTRVALWTHVHRRKLRYDLSGIEYDNWFSGEVNRQYGNKISAKNFFVNDLFISPVFRPAPTKAERIAQSMSKNVEANAQMRDNSLTEIEQISRQLMTGLRRFNPTLLGTTQAEDGVIRSSSAEFYSRILNGGESGPVRLNNYSIRYAIQRNHLSFKGDIITIEAPAHTRYAGILSIKAPYATEKVKSDLLDGLLTLQCEFMLSQSITFMSASKAEKFLTRQRTQIATTTGNQAQDKELSNAITDLQNGKFGMGEHEFILTIYGDSVAEVTKGIELAQAELEGKKSLDVIRESRGTLISQYFSMLPANFTMERVRAMPISTDNFARFFSMHNFMTGNAQGSQWGMPIAMLETTSGSPYFFNYHLNRNATIAQGAALEYVDDAEAELILSQDESITAAIEAERRAELAMIESEFEKGEFTLEETSKPEYDLDQDIAVAQKDQRKESGNYVAIGANGTGKTALIALLRSCARKVSNKGVRPYKTFTFDKDNGQETFIKASGGRYFPFKSNEETGINMFSMAQTPRNVLFILKIAKWCAATDPSYIPSVLDEKRLLKGIAETYKLTKGRRFARIRDLLPKEGTGSLYSVLGRWCDDGAYAWVLDSEEDRFDFEGANDFGFDMTSFLDDDYSRTPILAYIKHRIDYEAIGSPHSIEIDEAPHALKDAFLRDEIIEKEARTIRKKDGIIGLLVQNPTDVTEGPLAATLKQQFPTKFIFPNPTGDRKDYIDGLKLTEKEFELVKSGMLDEPGKFLLKQGAVSVVLRANLTGLNDILAVLSGSPENVLIANKIIERLGDDPSVWVPEFYKRRAV